MPTTAMAATPKPTQAQIDAAKKIEAEKKAAADTAAKKLNGIEHSKILKLKEILKSVPGKALIFTSYRWYL